MLILFISYFTKTIGISFILKKSLIKRDSNILFISCFTKTIGISFIKKIPLNIYLIIK